MTSSIFLFFKKKNFIVFAVLGAIYGILFGLGRLVTSLGKIPFGSPHTVTTVLGYAVVFSVLTLLLRGLVIPWVTQKMEYLNRRLDGRFWSDVGLFHFLILILVCWVPILLICWPGIFSYDTEMQYSQAMGLSPLNDHHPVLHTLFLRVCMKLGEVVFHSANGGMLVYSVFQMLINACLLSVVLTYICREVKAPSITLVSTAFICLFPLHGMLAICVTKDSMFSVFFVLLMMLLVQLDRSPRTFLRSVKWPLAFVLTACFAIFLRVNMPYAYIAAAMVLALLYYKEWKRCIPMLLLPVLLFWGIRGALYESLSVERSNSLDAFSLVFQEYAGVYQYAVVEGCGEPLSENELSLLYYLIKDEGLRSYDPLIADPVKSSCNPYVFSERRGDYLKLWIKWAFRYPSQYANAFLNLTYDYWYPGMKSPRAQDLNPIPMLELHCNEPVSFDSKWPGAFDALYELVEHFSYQKIPVIRLLFMNATYVWFLLYLCAEAIYRKKWGILRLMILPFLFFGTDLLGPVALFRYIYPLVLTCPLLCAELWRQRKN